ncbi:MAG: CPBP family intramembrane metalloprotease [Lachnospiraceae bacterium]|nr:CPBP family intramembrane metalloprotease [Lachnospiraceae bacterium]
MEMKRLQKFLIITFIITGLGWGSLAALTKLSVVSFTHPIGTVLHIIGGFGPTIASLFALEEKISFKSAVKFIFHYKRKTIIYFWILAAMAIAVIGISSMEFNSALPWYLIPIVFLQAVFIYGGEEELGWRGIMQPILEKKYSFPIATIITGTVWGVWHIPLWFVEGSSQQNMAFPFFLVLGVLLSFFLAALYKRSQCVFLCNVFHGLINTLLSMFVIKLNLVLVFGLIMMLAYSVYLWYAEEKK